MLTVIILVVVIFTLSGCGYRAAGQSLRNTNDNMDKPEINIFTLYSETNFDSGSVNFLRALEMAREEFPDYIINHETADVETYKTKIKMMIAANETPDIFYSWGGGFVQPFVEADYVLALDDYLDDETKGRMKPGAFDSYVFDDMLYGLPSYLWVGVLYCNEEMFAREVSIDNPAVEGAASLTLELVAAGAFPEGTFSLRRDEVETDFMHGQTAMEFMGSWLSGMLDGTEVDGKVAVVKFPSADGAVDQNLYFGGDNGALCVGADCPYPEEIVAVCTYLAEQCAILDGGLVTWEIPEEAMTNVNPLNRQVMAIIADAKRNQKLLPESSKRNRFTSYCLQYSGYERGKIHYG